MHYHKIKYLLLLFVSCNPSNQNIDYLITNEKIFWGMPYNSLSNIINHGYNMQFLESEKIGPKVSYIFLGGSFHNIPLKGVKFIFEADSLTGYDIWIDCKDDEEMNAKYYNLESYFSKIGEFNYHASNDAWMLYFIGKDGVKKYVTDIFMLKNGNRILIHVHKMYSNKESIFIK